MKKEELERAWAEARMLDRLALAQFKATKYYKAH